MNEVFDHIEQTRYLLSQVFESGFTSVRNISAGLDECEKAATELGMSGGAALIHELSSKLTALRAGQNTLSSVAVAYCNVVTYYNMVADMLIVETLSKQDESKNIK